jgi:hypothetical protein
MVTPAEEPCAQRVGSHHLREEQELHANNEAKHEERVCRMNVPVSRAKALTQDKYNEWQRLSACMPVLKPLPHNPNRSIEYSGMTSIHLYDYEARFLARGAELVAVQSCIGSISHHIQSACVCKLSSVQCCSLEVKQIHAYSDCRQGMERELKPEEEGILNTLRLSVLLSHTTKLRRHG